MSSAYKRQNNEVNDTCGDITKWRRLMYLVVGTSN